ASERPALRVVADQIGCPTAALDLARALQVIVLRLLCDPNAPTGTFHFVNAGQATWHGLATPAPRPSNSRLSVAGLTKAYGIVPRPWPEAVAEAVDSFLDSKSSS